MQPLPEAIATERLSIRRWQAGDGGRLTAAVQASVEHLRPWMAWIGYEPLDERDREVLIGQWHRDWQTGGDLVVGILQDETVVGGAGLHRRAGPDTLEIGYWIHVDHLDKGIATEAARALTTLAFTVPGIERVEIHHDKANVVSSRIPARLGYAFLGEEEDSLNAPNEVGFDCCWAMTRQAWPAASAG